MLYGLTIVVSALLNGEPESTTIRADRFEGWFQSAVAGGLKVPPAVAREARTFRYVFVGGFRNEGTSDYFAQNRAELKSLGIPVDQVHVISPSSSRTTEANAEDVRSKFVEIAAEGPERLVVIGHSRGACDALLFAVGNPAFVENRVEAMFLIQGPFGGSGVADYVSGSGVPMDRRMGLGRRIVGNLMAKFARNIATDSQMKAIEGMTLETSREFWARTLQKDQESLSEVGKKIFYVRSALHPARQRFARRAIAWYLQTYHGSGDGMVVIEDQSISGLGTVVATVEAGHSDFTHGPISSRARRGYRRALTRSIVMGVGRARLESLPTSIKIPPSDSSGGRFDLRQDSIPEGLPSLEGRRRREPGISPSDRVVPTNR